MKRNLSFMLIIAASLMLSHCGILGPDEVGLFIVKTIDGNPIDEDSELNMLDWPLEIDLKKFGAGVSKIEGEVKMANLGWMPMIGCRPNSDNCFIINTIGIYDESERVEGFKFWFVLNYRADEMEGSFYPYGAAIDCDFTDFTATKQ